MVMESNDGAIECNSVEGEYTEFVLTFPIVQLTQNRLYFLHIDKVGDLWKILHLLAVIIKQLLYSLMMINGF